MKRGVLVKKSIFIVLGLLTLVGCSNRGLQEEVGMNPETELSQETVEISNNSELNEEEIIDAKEAEQSVSHNNSDGESSNTSESTSTTDEIMNTSEPTISQSDTSSETIKNNEQFTHSVAFDNMLYYEYIDPTHFETNHYLSLGDEIELIDNEQVYATVTLNNFKVVDDNNGTGRKALALFYTQTNVSDVEIESGPFGIADNPTFSSNFVADDKNFKIMSHTTPSSKMYDENYIKNQHVEYTEADAGVESCTRVKVLKPGESRECYAHYTLMGATTYKVGYMSEINFNEWRTYLIKVTTEDIIK